MNTKFVVKASNRKAVVVKRKDFLTMRGALKFAEKMLRANRAVEIYALAVGL